MLTIAALLAVTITADFNEKVGAIRPELHGSGFGPTICSCPQANIDIINEMGFSSTRTHDWALLNENERVCDYFHIFPLLHRDPKDPANYVFGPTDYLLNRVREELTGKNLLFRLGTSIEHSGPKVHFNSLIPDEKDFDTIAESFAATVRHYNKGWANGHEWGIKYWEIWNEPDGRNNMWCLPSDDTTPANAAEGKRQVLFAKFFAKCLKRLKSEFPEEKVGGPALCSLKKPYFTALFEACKKEGVKPDFISWHQYTCDPENIKRCATEARKLCDSHGLKDCEIILDEWHYLGREYNGFAGLRSADKKQRKLAWTGPGSHNGIDSSCFNLVVLSGIQTSPLDRAYYYGCRMVGSWGAIDAMRNKYKVFYGLKLFGDLVRDYKTICSSKSDSKPAKMGYQVSSFAVKSEDGRKMALLVSDFRSKAKELSIEVKGVPEGAKARAWVHDYTRDMEEVPVEVGADGKFTFTKADDNSAALFVEFSLPQE